jgi:hypothetical protein
MEEDVGLVLATVAAPAATRVARLGDIVPEKRWTGRKQKRQPGLPFLVRCRL